ncbi:MAG: hypothetical protein AUG89_01855 [Acidobacteria bacterium 13_1_20CM_4_56_7]|jgi:hypothetical protein|nr:MAG: hypothetical protein AUG89_01855 [Acidobacteria bacterium 13_1_20CM_4_56_7]
MRERSSRFVKNFFGALGRCFIDEPISDLASALGEGIDGILGLLIMVAACAFIACLFYGFFQVGYELMFDPNATDVASRLASISISPGKWS